MDGGGRPRRRRCGLGAGCGSQCVVVKRKVDGCDAVGLGAGVQACRRWGKTPCVQMMWWRTSRCRCRGRGSFLATWHGRYSSSRCVFALSGPLSVRHCGRDGAREARRSCAPVPPSPCSGRCGYGCWAGLVPAVASSLWTRRNCVCSEGETGSKQSLDVSVGLCHDSGSGSGSYCGTDGAPWLCGGTCLCVTSCAFASVLFSGLRCSHSRLRQCECERDRRSS